jgi:hypothetical protein
MHIKTKLSLAHHIIDLDRAASTEEDMKDDDTRYDVFQRLHMFGNERFVIVWSHAFVYIMSFDLAFRFEYDEDEISKSWVREVLTDARRFLLVTWNMVDYAVISSWEV